MMGWTTVCGMHTVPPERRGFVLIGVLLLLAASFAGATGIFVAARAELHTALNHAAAEKTFHAVDGGLRTWFAAPVQPASAGYEVGGIEVRVEALALLAVDSAIVLYLVVARAEPGDVSGSAPHTVVARTISMLGRTSGSGSVEPMPGTWRERF